MVLERYICFCVKLTQHLLYPEFLWNCHSAHYTLSIAFLLELEEMSYVSLWESRFAHTLSWDLMVFLKHVIHILLFEFCKIAVFQIEMSSNNFSLHLKCYSHTSTHFLSLLNCLSTCYAPIMVCSAPNFSLLFFIALS